MPSSPLWKLRRLASRGKRVVERRSGESPALSVFTATTPGKADAFISSYDSAARYASTWKRELAEGKGAIFELLKSIRSWLPLVVRDVPSFSPADYGDKPEVPDDVLEDAGRLRDFVADDKVAGGKPLPWASKCTDDLDAKLKPATKEWTEADAADRHYQALLQAVRDTGKTLDEELIALRRAIASHTSRSDKDYQKLRVERAAQPDEEDDPNAPKPPAPVKAAAPGATHP